MRISQGNSPSARGRSLPLTAAFGFRLAAILAAILAIAVPGVHAEEIGFLLSPPPTASLAPPAIEGIRLPLSERWRASYGLGLAEETALTWTAVRSDQTLAYGTRSDGEVRRDWRHFLGLEYAPFEGFSLLGGIAKAGGLSGGKGSSTSPTGYERLRLNLGARWRSEDWGIDGSFAFIPTGAGRVPSDASFLPGSGGGGSTYYLSLTVSRRF